MRQRICGQCSVALAVEVGLFLCTMCLACIGHTIFWWHTYEQEDSSAGAVEKCVLGLMNAALTGSLLILFQRLLQRCHRDGVLVLESRGALGESAATGTAEMAIPMEGLATDSEVGDDRLVESAGYLVSQVRAMNRSLWSYVYLGAGLSMTAAFEFYLVFKAL